jgi:hypothetical protein
MSKRSTNGEIGLDWREAPSTRKVPIDALRVVYKKRPGAFYSYLDGGPRPPETVTITLNSGGEALAAELILRLLPESLDPEQKRAYAKLASEGEG